MYESKKDFDEINLVDLFTLLFTKLTVFIVLAIIGLILGVGFSFYSGTREEAIEDYEKAVRNYERSIAYQESDLAFSEEELARQQNYLTSSPYMKLNADDLYTSLVSISLSPEAGAYTEVVPNPSAVIATGYVEYFNTLDLQEVYHSEFLHSWIRDYVTTYVSNNNVIIRAYANSAQEAESLTDAILVLFETEKERIGMGTFPHEIIVNKTTTHGPSSGIATSQFNKRTSINEASDAITEKQENLKEYIAKEHPSQFHHLKYGVIGGFALAFLYAIWVCLKFIFSQTIATSYSLESNSDSPFLGYVAKRKKSIADLIAKERVFSSQEDAKAFLNAQLETLSSAESIAFLSSVSISEAAKAELASSLKVKIVCVDKAATNPETVEAVKSADLIILLAKPWVSTESDAKIINSIVERCEKKISGFVFFN